MTCPICKKSNVTAGHILGHSTSDAKAQSSAHNGKLGGRPTKDKTTRKLKPKKTK
jgi:hypothetical protein